MKKTTVNKILIIVYSLLVSLTMFWQIDRYKELQAKLALAALALVTILLYSTNVNRINYYTFIDGVLTVWQTFSKQKKYSLKDVSSWSENQYELLGFKTRQVIFLKTKDGTKINLLKKNSKDFEKLSDYLNENFPDAFEN
jgi:hypothetical protein